GVSPNSPARNGPGTVGLAVVCGGVPVAAGDIVIGDPDGVVIVPRGEIRGVLAQLAAVRANEAKMLKAVQGGLKEPGFMTAILVSAGGRYTEEWGAAGRIAVIGAGARGSVLGARLQSMGGAVTLFDINQAHIDAIGARGLMLGDASGERLVRIPATSRV